MNSAMRQHPHVDEPGWANRPEPSWGGDEFPELWASPPPWTTPKPWASAVLLQEKADASDVRPYADTTRPEKRTRTQLRAISRDKHRARHDLALRIAEPYDGVLTRQMLIKSGVTAGQTLVEVNRGAWHPIGCHTLSVIGPQVGPRAWLWWALWESTRQSVLDGPTALIAGGLTGWTESVMHLSVPNNVPVRDLPGVRHHRGRDIGPSVGTLRRTPPMTATIRAAQWAITDRAAATLVAMAVQQRLVRPEELLKAWDAVGYSHRRDTLDGIIADVCQGAQSLAEIDFARLCRERGLPEPSRQVVRNESGGRVYLDVYWEEFGVHVEINGAQHYQGTARIDDALRGNAIAISSADVISLQVPVSALYACRELFLDQVERALAEGRRRTALRQAG